MRPSHAELMEAQEALGRARQKEIEAGNHDLGMALNNIVIGVFKIALSDDYADEITRVHAEADS